MMNTTALKWTATAVLIVGTAVNSMGYYPAGPILLILGGLIWLAVSIQWREPALIATNSLMTLAAVVPLVYKWLTTGF
jgi:hypothetical protein